MHRIRSGLEVFLDRCASPRRRPAGPVGLLAHPASIDANGRHALELLREAGIDVARLFAPEHGLRGEAQDMEPVDERVDPGSGIPIVSLYGTSADSLTPAPSAFDGLRTLVVDLQDVGSRYYTFVYTMAHCMETAAATGVSVTVLDRPNPIGGAMEGPVLDGRRFASFVGRYPLPARHGMTCGELALLFNDRFDIGCELELVEMEGWRRRTYHDETGLPWVAPSPNMPSMATALVYPGGCLVEGTNLSEGRGTTQPFELVGAPWLDPDRLAASLRGAKLPGATFRPAWFRPMFHKHARRSCGGVQVIVDDRTAFRPFGTYLCLIREARRLARGEFDWRREPYEFESDRLAIDLLLGRGDLRAMLESDATLDEIEAAWEDDLLEFASLRRPYLRYRD